MFRCLALALAATLLVSTQADAQLFRAYLALDGSDANPCTLQQPCRLLPAALSAVADGGEIWIVDSANYTNAPVAITKSVTILAVPGVLGSVVASGGNALTVAGANIHVALRNLNILPLPGNENMIGVVVTQADALTVVGCTFSGFSAGGGLGLRVSTDARVGVVDSVFRRNNFGAHFENASRGTISGSTFLYNSVGVGVAASAGQTTHVDVSRSTISFSSNGMQVSGNGGSALARASVSEVTLSGNNYGAVSFSANSGFGRISVYNSHITDNTIGLNGSTGRIVAGGNLVTHNGTGFTRGTGTFESAGNNVMRDNDMETSGTIVGFAPQ